MEDNLPEKDPVTVINAYSSTSGAGDMILKERWLTVTPNIRSLQEI